MSELDELYYERNIREREIYKLREELEIINARINVIYNMERRAWQEEA